MGTETLYRHKKFNKLNRELDPSIFTIIPKPSVPKENTEKPIQPEKKFEPEANALPVKLEHTENPAKRRKSIPKDANDSYVKIKIEPKSPSHQSDNEYGVRIKQELIELNTNVPRIPPEAYNDICKFRGNMVRKFPKVERSAKEQERRDKNTFACRRSRRVKKIEQVAIEEEYKGFKDTHLRFTEYSIRSAAYFKELMNRADEMSDIIVVD